MKQPALLLAIGVIAGVALSSWLPLAIAFGVAVVVLCRYPVAAFGIVIGSLRILVSPLAPPAADLIEVAGKERTIHGIVDSYPDYRKKYQQFVVRGTAEGKAGKALVQTDPLLEFSPGDRATATGRLDEPKVSDELDYRSYLAKDGIHTIMRRADVRTDGREWTWRRMFYVIRKAWVRQTERTFTEPTAGLILGILIGERSTLSDEHIEAFRRTGTTHILALSGFNISIIIAAIVWVLGRKSAALVVSLSLILAFVLLVGPSASVVRAALMGGFLLLGQLFGRPQVAMYAAVLTAAGMLLMQPHALRYDLGFDLSFLATLGILWLEPDIRERLGAVPDVVRGIVSATLAAGLATAPLIALTFGTASLVSPFANLLTVLSGHTFLFPGDAEESEERRLAGRQLDAEVLKVPHHGSRTSSTAEFIDAVTPGWCVISLGEDNKYGHPDPGTINRLRDAGCRVVRTDRHGTITATISGSGLKLTASGSRP